MDRMPSIDSLLASSASLMQYMRIIWIIREYKYIALHYSALHLYSALHYTVHYIIQCITLYSVLHYYYQYQKGRHAQKAKPVHYTVHCIIHEYKSRHTCMTTVANSNKLCFEKACMLIVVTFKYT